MFSPSSSELDLEIPCRSLASVRADKVENRFWVGSSSIQELNELYLVQGGAEGDRLQLDATYAHEEGPIQCIAASPTDESLVLTVTEQQSSAVLWRNAPNDGAPEQPPLEEVTRVEAYDGSAIADVDWRDPSDDAVGSSSGDVVLVDRHGRVTRWDLSAEAAAASSAVQAEEGLPDRCSLGRSPRVQWDPHSPGGNALAVSRNERVHLLDWRIDTSVPSGVVESWPAHAGGLGGIGDIDYNPNKPFVLVTAGLDDGLLKYWDLRAARHPLLVTRGGHSHWISQVHYNPSHDQLVISSGTDGISNLWRVSTISSAPLLFDDNQETANVRVDRHEHGESVYASSWGAADAWSYASVSFQGKVTVNQVPSKEKYKILL